MHKCQIIIHLHIWASGVQLKHSLPLVQYIIQKIVGGDGCPVIITQ